MRTHVYKLKRVIRAGQAQSYDAVHNKTKTETKMVRDLRHISIYLQSSPLLNAKCFKGLHSCTASWKRAVETEIKGYRHVKV